MRGMGTLGQHLGAWPLGLGAAGRLVSADQRASALALASASDGSALAR